jgi:PAS domain S-box-containing protein
MESLYEKSKEELIEEINALRNTVEHLKQADTKFEDLTEKSLVGVYLIRDNLFGYVNPKLAQIFGYTVDEIINKLGPKDLVFQEDKQIVEENIRKRINGEIQSANYVFRGSKKDGSEIYIEVFGSRTLVDNKPSVIGTLLDITDKTKMELGLRENELKYRNLFEHSPVSLWEEDFTLLKIFLDGIMETGIDDLRKYFDENPEIVQRCTQMVEVINVNDAAVKLHGAKSKENLIGNLDKVFTEKSYKAFKEELIAVAEGKENVIVHGEVRTLDGEVRYVIVDVNISYMTRNGEARTTAILAINDITERKKAEEAIIESKRMLDDVFNTIPVRVFWKDTEGVYLGCNNLFAKDAGRNNPDDIIGDNDYNMGWAEQAELYRSDDRQVIESGKPKINYEEPQTTPDGNLIWLNTSKIPLRNSNGSVYGVLGTYEDITERKKVEKELMESRELYRASIEAAPYGIAVINKDGEFLISNNQLVKISGYNKNEIPNINTWFNKLYPNEKYREQIIKSYSQAIDENGLKTREAEITRKDGEKRTCQFVVSILSSGTRIIFVDDITERKFAEDALIASEERYRFFSESAFEGIAVIDNGKLIDVSSQLVDMLEYNIDEMLGKNVTDFVALESRDIVTKNIVAGFEETYEITLLTKKGVEIPVEVRGKAMPYRGNQIRVTAVRNIAERKTTEKALLEKEKNLSLIYDTVGDVIFQLSVEPEDCFRFLSVNKRFLEATGLNTEQIIGKKYDEIIPELQLDNVLKNYKKAIHERRTIQWEETSNYPSGELTGIVSVSPFFDEQDECKYLIGSVHNITERKIAENKLKQSEESYRGLFNNATDSIYIQDIEGRFLDVNEGAVKLYGYAREEFIGRTPEFLSAPGKNDLKKLDEHIKKTLAGIPQQFEFYGRKKDGTIIPKIVRLQKGQYFEKEVIIAFAIDITERKKAEARIAGLANILETSLNEIYIIDAITLKFIQANKGARKNLGYSNFELEHLTPVDIKPEQDIESFERLIAPLRNGEKNIVNFETVHKRKDGSQYPVEVHMQLIQLEDKSVFVAFILDISERKKGEIALQKSEESLKLAQEFGKVGSWDWDIVNNKSTWSDQAYIQMGLKPNEVEPSKEVFENLIHPDDRQLVHNAIERSFQNDEPYSLEVRMVKPDGTEWIMHTAGRAIRDEEGNPIRFAGVQQDITERKLAEEEIRKLSHSVEQSPAIVIITDTEGIIEYVNPKFVEVTGYSSEEVIGKKTNVLKSSDTSQDEYEILWDTIKSGEVWQGEFHNKKKNGELYWESATISGIKNAAGKISHFVAIKEDITKRKEAEMALLESEAKWRSITENSPDHIMLLNRDAKILFMNRSVSDLNKEEVIGKSVYDFVPKEFHDIARERFETAFNIGKTQSFETTYKANDGDVHYFSVRLGPVYKEGKVVALVSSSTDITKEKKIENRLKDSYVRLRNLAERLQMVREEERASVAREIHDDLGQSLTALKMDMAWLKNNPEMSEEEKLNKINTMLSLTDSTIQTVKRIATQLRPGILDDLGLVPAIEWQTEEFQNRFNIQCNLSINRKDVILKDEISIAVFRIFQETLTNVARHSGATVINIDLNFKDNNELVLEIVDNGKGIKKAEIYSPKSFGLFGMKERVNILNGKLKIVGKKNKGTKVNVSIPY